MVFNIPSKFQLGGYTIQIEKVSQITGEDLQCDSMAFYHKTKIELKDDDIFSKDYKEYVFWHEYFHHLFNAINDDALRTNEKLISQLALFQMQAIRTME